MPDRPDFRSDPMSSLEGVGIARRRWKAFNDQVPDDVWEAIYEARGPFTDAREENVFVQADMAESAIERADLLGFWLAWHLAGGFANLEEGGWHRATIHRRIRRFRERFGLHPDEYAMAWLRVDLEKAWKDNLVRMQVPVEEPDR